MQMQRNICHNTPRDVSRLLRIIFFFGYFSAKRQSKIVLLVSLCCLVTLGMMRMLIVCISFIRD